MKLIYKHDSEYYSIWIKIRTNPRVWDERTDLIIEMGSRDDRDDVMRTEFMGLSMCGMISATKNYFKWAGPDLTVAQDAVSSLESKLPEILGANH